VLSEKLNRTPEQEDRENIYYIDSSDLGNSHLEEMKQAIIEKKPRIIFSYSSTLVELAHHIDRTGIPEGGFSMISVLTGGEGISEENRQFLERVFGCTVYRRYSDMELGILGQDTGNGSEYLLNWGSYYFECLKIGSDEPAESGEVGRIVITDLFNYAFPMIRYDTGDLGVMHYCEGELPRLKEIYGRVRDCVYTVDGRLLSPAKIFVSMWGSERIKQWQFIQEDKALYILKLNCDSKIDKDTYISKFKNLLGDSATIQIELVDEIPVTSSNKRRAVICNYRKE
jgi:phenylacetate-CoA ligase